MLGVVPKSVIPGYSEFYEPRWFASGAGISGERIDVAGQSADFGTDLTFEVNGAEFGIEICEDLWAAVPPSSLLAAGGAKVIFNLSASPEVVGKHDYLRQLVAQQSARTLSAYVYCSAGFGESSTDLVFAGNALIAENGRILREAERFSADEQLVVADVDLQRLEFERRRNTSFRANEGATENTVIEMEIPEGLRGVALDRDIDPMPFVPRDERRRSERCEEVFRIQSHGLARRLRHTRCQKAVIGISGGLDSTLALLVAVRAFDFLGLDRQGILGITMPGFGTTDRTYRNALQLMRGLGVTVREIPIRDACLQHFRDIGLPPEDRSAAYENAQARERTQILMDVANMEGGLVIGTGDLSELALGWATYNGDQMSMYGVNASVPKTLVRHLVRWVADTAEDGATVNEAYDTLKEVAEYLTAHGDVVQGFTTDIAGLKTAVEALQSGMTKVEHSDTNGNVKVDGAEVVVYQHPATHPASMITDTAEKVMMTATERQKLGGIAAGASAIVSGTGTVADATAVPTLMIKVIEDENPSA